MVHCESDSFFVSKSFHYLWVLIWYQVDNILSCSKSQTGFLEVVSQAERRSVLSALRLLSHWVLTLTQWVGLSISCLQKKQPKLLLNVSKEWTLDLGSEPRPFWKQSERAPQLGFGFHSPLWLPGHYVYNSFFPFLALAVRFWQEIL